MNSTPVKAPAFLTASLALMGWFALVAQLILLIQNRVVPVAETVTRYFSYFTILTNLLAAVCVTVLFIKPKNVAAGFLVRPTTVTAITVYIAITGIVYNVILRFLWQPEGLQFVADELLHTVIPLLFIVLWLLYVPKAELAYKQVLSWLIYPFLYLVYTLIHGSISGFYPYPFMDVGVLGYKKLLLNAAVLLILFSGLSLFLVSVGKYLSRKKIGYRFYN